MLSEATSGLKVAAGRTRSSIVMVGAPPVVMLMTQSERCLITWRKGAKASGDWSGRPSAGSRAWRWTIAAPASAAPIAASAISSGVTGRCGDIEGVWIAPVTAQVMMTLPLDCHCPSFLFANVLRRAPLVRGERHQAPVAPELALDEIGLPAASRAARARRSSSTGAGPVDPALHLTRRDSRRCSW